MPIDPTAAIGQTPSQPTTSSAGLGQLDGEAFLNLLVAQMRYQDPMSPTDATTMLQQTSQFTQVETLQQVSQMQQQLLGMTQASMASDLVGKEVFADTDDGELSGVVDGVRFSGSGPMLAIGAQEVPLSQITSIHDNPAGEVAPAPEAPGSDDDDAILT